MTPRQARALRWLTGLVLLDLAVAPWPTALIERLYARGLYPLLSRALAPLVDATGVSLTLSLLAAWVLVSLGTLASRRVRRRFVPNVLAAMLGLAVSFLWMWGLAYRREPLQALLGLGDEPITSAQAAAAVDALLPDLASPRAGTTRDRVAAAGRCVESEVARVSHAFVPVPRRVRTLPPGALLAFGFSGITSPWLHEPHVDGGLPQVAFVATAAHELAHAAGFAREADTDALAVLAGLSCDDPGVRYALALHAVELIAGAVPADARTPLLERLPDAARTDLDAIAAAAARYRVGPLAGGAARVYGGYLKSQGVQAGMADYDRATALVIRALASPAAP